MILRIATIMKKGISVTPDEYAPTIATMHDTDQRFSKKNLFISALVSALNSYPILVAIFQNSYKFIHRKAPR
jgi:hypothetical protein